MPMRFVGVEAQHPSELCAPDGPEGGAYALVRVPVVPTLMQGFDLLTDALKSFRASRGAQMPTVFHLDEPEKQSFARDYRHIDEVGAALPSRPDCFLAPLKEEAGREHRRRE